MSYHCKCMTDKECITTLCHGAHYLTHPYFSKEDVAKHTDKPVENETPEQGTKGAIK